MIVTYTSSPTRSAEVVRLGKNYFVILVDGREIRLTYRGEPTARRVSKAHERYYGVSTPAGVYGDDLCRIRAAAGLATD